jgi:ABC-type dipeptide/oligopeptide/nickel transport system permease subunit
VNCRRLVGRHLLYLFGYFLVLESTLSYVGGFGVREPMPSWGNMLVFAWGRRADNPWTVLAPGLAVLATVGAVAWVAEALGEGRRP